MTVPGKFATDQKWISFHKDLKRIFSKKEANQWFMRFWNQNAGQNSSANTSALRSYLKDEGVELTAGTIGGRIGDFASGIGSGFGTFFRVLGGVAVVGVIVAGVIIYKKIK